MPEKRIEMIIAGMHCDACVASVRHALKRCPGVSRVDVALGKAEIAFDDASCAIGDLVKALESAGSFEMTGFRPL